MSAQTQIETVLDEAGLTQEQVGQALGLTGSAINHKLAGRRPWKQDEVSSLLALLSERLNRAVTYESLFPAAVVEEQAQ